MLYALAVAGRGGCVWGAERTRAAGPRRAKHHTASRSPFGPRGHGPVQVPGRLQATSPLARAAPPPPLLRWLQPHQPMDSLGCFSGAAFHRVYGSSSQFALDNLPQPCLGAPADVFRWTWALLVLPRPFLWVGPSGGEKKKKPHHGHHVVNLAQSGLPTEGHTISMQLNS